MPDRKRLPQRRLSVTREVRFWSQMWELTVGFYEDGSPGEVFISGGKAGTDLEAMARDGAVLLSFCLQYGVPINVLAPALTRNRDGSPSALTGAIADRLVEESRS